MKRISLLVITVACMGCTTLYSTPATWKANEGKVYQFTAHSRLGFSGRAVDIFVNGQKLMTAKARYWAKQITMTSELDGQQVAAVCGGEEGARSCVITVSGEQVASLKF